MAKVYVHFRGRRNPALEVKGRTRGSALGSAKRFLREHKLINAVEGFEDAAGFHPIRSSADYDPGRVGEGRRSRRRRGGRKSSRRKARRRR